MHKLCALTVFVNPKYNYTLFLIIQLHIVYSLVSHNNVFQVTVHKHNYTLFLTKIHKNLFLKNNNKTSNSKLHTVSYKKTQKLSLKYKIELQNSNRIIMIINHQCHDSYHAHHHSLEIQEEGQQVVQMFPNQFLQPHCYYLQILHTSLNKIKRKIIIMFTQV